MNVYGLIGYPLGHSFSQKYFTEKFFKEKILESEYQNFPIKSINSLPDIIENNSDLIGLNVTIPYKQTVIDFLDEINEIAKSIGAVNTIKIYREKNNIYLKGYNTDEYGFHFSIKPFLNSEHKRALILGTGGSSKAVSFVLDNLKINYLFVSRNPKNNKQISYSDLNKSILHDYQLIINTSPAGMYPNVNDCPAIDYECITETHILYDLIYNPETTLFLKKGKERGAKTINGLSMLQLQAERAWQIWNEKD